MLHVGVEKQQRCQNDECQCWVVGDHAFSPPPISWQSPGTLSHWVESALFSFSSRIDHSQTPPTCILVPILMLANSSKLLNHHYTVQKHLCWYHCKFGGKAQNTYQTLSPVISGDLRLPLHICVESDNRQCNCQTP